MLTTEIVTINGRTFKHTSSDLYLIKKVNTEEVYTSAYDVLESSFVYEETAELLPSENEE